MKALLLSVRPEHAIKILNGEKTRELRKSIPKGFIGWVYGYVTKGKPYLWSYGRIKENSDWEWETVYQTTQPFHARFSDNLNGTIPFRFWFEEYEEVLVQHHIDSEQIERVLKQACIEHDDLDNYVGNKETIYAWHIKKLEVFDKPMKLGEFQNYMPKSNDIPEALITSSWQILHQPLTKAPQSYQYVYVKGE